MSNSNETILEGQEARDVIISGLNKLANVVKITLGPCGRNVILADKHVPTVTKDGVSVARSVSLNNSWENIVAKLIKNVSIKAEQTAGDGTTTATVLAQAMIQYGLTLTSNGTRPSEVVTELTTLTTKAKAHLKNIRVEIDSLDDLISVATVSANGDNVLAEVVARAVYSVGKFGLVNIKKGSDSEDIVDVTTGYTIPRGLEHSSLRNSRTGFKVPTAKVLVISDDVDSTAEIDTLLAYIINVSTTDFGSGNWLLIMSEPNDDICLRMNNILRQQTKPMSVAIVRAPASGKSQAETMIDIATIAGTTVTGIHSLVDFEYGNVTDLLIDNNNTTFNYADDVDGYVELLTKDLTEARSNYDKNRINERIARIKGGVSTIYVGGFTEAEVGERHDRFDDAVRATQGAWREGVVVGGGHALLVTSNNMLKHQDLTDFKNPTAAIEVLRTPYRQILLNADYTGTDIEHAIDTMFNQTSIDQLTHINVLSGEFMMEEDYKIVDPYLVAVTTLDTALSIAKLAITTGAIVGPSNNKVPSLL